MCAFHSQEVVHASLQPKEEREKSGSTGDKRRLRRAGSCLKGQGIAGKAVDVRIGRGGRVVTRRMWYTVGKKKEKCRE